RMYFTQDRHPFPTRRSSDLLEVEHKDLYRKPGQVGVQLKVTLKADAPPGALKEFVYLKTNDPASPMVPVLVEAHVLASVTVSPRSEEHTSELQSLRHLVCRL